MGFAPSSFADTEATSSHRATRGSATNGVSPSPSPPEDTPAIVCPPRPGGRVDSYMGRPRLVVCYHGKVRIWEIW